MSKPAEALLVHLNIDALRELSRALGARPARAREELISRVVEVQPDLKEIVCLPAVGLREWNDSARTLGLMARKTKDELVGDLERLVESGLHVCPQLLAKTAAEVHCSSHLSSLLAQCPGWDEASVEHVLSRTRANTPLWRAVLRGQFNPAGVRATSEVGIEVSPDDDWSDVEEPEEERHSGRDSARGDTRDREGEDEPVTDGVVVRRGAGERIRAFCEDLAGWEVIWVSYTFAPPDDAELMAALRKLGSIRVVVQHPQSNPDDQHPVQISLPHYERWVSEFNADSLRGYRTGGAEDGEAQACSMHAKLIVARRGKRHQALVGSFNLAIRSLRSNVETLARLDSAQLTGAAWNEAEELWERSDEISREDCNDQTLPSGKRYRPDHPKAPPREYEEDDAELAASPDALRRMQRTLNRMLREWPPGGEGWQRKQFNALWRHMERHELTWEVLHLPVGVGKTFIAIRWLLQCFDEGSLRQGRRGLFLVPNEWIERSVKDARDRLLEQACREHGEARRRPLSDVLDQCVSIARAYELSRSLAAISAVVVDECHNWNPSGATAGRRTYQGVVTALRAQRGTRGLGLSATPCRMNEGKFDIPTFVERFRRPSKSVATRLNLWVDKAVEMGLLCPYKIENLHGRAASEVRSLLGETAGRVVRYGDYSEVVLREAWEALDHTPHRGEVLAQIGKRLAKAKRALVFLPPVGALADRFVRDLKAKVDAGGRGLFFDFRERAGDDDRSARAIFKAFRDAPSRLGRPPVLVTVDRFSEGVSIDDIDLLVMVRATLSPRVAMQALGRGLRLDPDNPEKVCVVFDAACFGDRLSEMRQDWS